MAGPQHRGSTERVRIPHVFGKAQALWGSKIGNGYLWAPYGSLAFGDLYVKS